MPGSRRPAVAIVDDEVKLRELFTAMLADEYRIRKAASGEAALELTDDDLDVMLLNRNMAGLSGEDVLRRLREADYDIPVAMVTADVPDFDVLKLSCDAYVIKPIGTNELRETIETLLLITGYDEVIRECYAFASKLAALRSTKPSAVLESDGRYARAQRRLEVLKRRALRSLDSAIESGKFEEPGREITSIERLFEGIDDVDGPEFRVDW